MWHLRELHWENVLSFGPASLTLRPGHTHLIYGKNLDNEGANSNGSGKSVIFEVITLALTGGVHRGVNQADVVRDGEKSAFVRALLVHADGRELVIEREFYAKKSSTVQVYLGGERQSTRDFTVDEANAYILELLGLEAEDLLNFYVLNQGNDYSFLTATDATKKRIINRLSDIRPVERALEQAKADLKAVESQVAQQETVLVRLKASLAQSEQHIQLEQQSAVQQVQELVNTYLAEAAAFGQQQQRALLKANELNLRADEIAEQAAAIVADTDLIAKYDAELVRLNGALEKNHAEQRKAGQRLRALQVAISGTICCPSCDHKFVPNFEGRSPAVQELQVLEQECQARQNALELDAQALQQAVQEQEQGRKEAQKALNQRRQLEEDALYHRRQADRQLAEAKMAEQNASRVTRKAHQLREDAADTSKIQALRQQADDLRKQVEQQRVVQNQLTEKVGFYTEMTTHLGRAGFQNHLVRMVLAYLQDAINTELQRFATDMTVSVDAQTVKRSGELSDKIDVTVYRRGQVFRLGKLSGGERNRLQLASLLAVQGLINGSSATGGLNLLALDETFENLDVQGQHELLRCLRSSQKTALCVSHSVWADVAEDSADIVVQKKNGVSTLQKWPELS